MMLDGARVDREFVRSVRSDQQLGIDPLADSAHPAFEEEPLPLQRFLTDARYLRLPRVSEIQLRMLKRAERVLFEPTFDALGWEKVPSPTELWLAWGKGSGKDFVSRVMLSRIAYLLLCLESPQVYFGMPVTEKIYMTNVAVAAPQARRIFFEPWVAMLRGSPWFRSRIEPGVQIIDFDKMIQATSGHSQSESQEGQNLIAAVLDEIAAFKTASELVKAKRERDREPESSAEGIVKTLRSSIVSRFPHTGKLVGLSFTRFKNDMIDQQVRQGQVRIDEVGEEAARVFVSRAATWEVNPMRRREDFADEYRKDAQDAAARYECQPSSSPYRFFQNILALRKAMGIPLAGDVPTKPMGSQVGVHYECMAGEAGNRVWEVSFDFSRLEHHHQPLAIHFDIGISHDLAGVAATHVEGFRDDGRPLIKTDFVLAFEQQRGDPVLGIPPSDIQIRWIRQLVTDLMDAGFAVSLVTGDGYQSTDTFQLLEAQGIETDRYSLDRNTEGYDVLKSLVYGGDVDIPFHPLLWTELESLLKISINKIDHQASLSKDMADALAGSVRGSLWLVSEGLVSAAAGSSWSGGAMEEAVEERREEDEMARLGMTRPRQPGTVTDGSGRFWSGG